MLQPADATAAVTSPTHLPDGTVLGTVSAVVVDPATSVPRWAELSTPDGSTVVVPLAHAVLDAQGLHVPVDAGLVRSAPPVRLPLGATDTALLSAHYGALDDPAAAPPTGSVRAPVEVVRSAERVRTRTETVVGARVRVVKRVVTEQRTITVPVRREELVVEPVPAEEAGAGTVVAAGLGEQPELVLTLHAERPVVTTEVVAVERVVVGTTVVRGTQVLTGPLRHEEVVVEQAPPAG